MAVFDFQAASYKELSGDILQVFLTSSDSQNIFDYQAGQYIEFLLPDESPKPFSIANAPASDQDKNTGLEFHIRHEKNNLYAKKLVDYIKLKKNQMISLRGPYGKLKYHADPKLDLLFVAAGTGFAPCKAIMEQAFQDKHRASIYLYWGARKKEDLYFHDKLNLMSQQIKNFNYIPVIGGRVYDTVLEQQKNLSDFHIYASGHQEMALTTQKLFQHPRYFYSDWLD